MNRQRLAVLELAHDSADHTYPNPRPPEGETLGGFKF